MRKLNKLQENQINYNNNQIMNLILQKNLKFHLKFNRFIMISNR